MFTYRLSLCREESILPSNVIVLRLLKHVSNVTCYIKLNNNLIILHTLDMFNVCIILPCILRVKAFRNPAAESETLRTELVSLQLELHLTLWPIVKENMCDTWRGKYVNLSGKFSLTSSIYVLRCRNRRPGANQGI